MNQYELVVIIHPGLDEDAVNQSLDKVKGWVAASDGEVAEIDTWGKRRLAYPIQKQNEGLYYLLNIEVAPSAIAELERNLHILEPVMRFSIIAKE